MWLIPLAPLAAAIVTALFGPKLLRERSHWPCWIGLAVSAVCAYALLLSIVPAGFHGEHGEHARSSRPAITGSTSAASTSSIELRADAMTAIMLSMVTFVSLLVAIFAAGYMHGDPGYPRFFAVLLAVRVLDVHAGAVGELPAAVRVLGRRGPVQLPADRLLVQQAERGGGGEEGVRRQPHRRLRLSASASF